MGLTVLIIDDDMHARKILEGLFRSDPGLSGLVEKVVTASDGEEGLQLFEKERPQVVVTDLLMPRKDGFAVCRAIRAHECGKETALIAISAVYKDLSVIQRLKSEFGAAFFQKPFQVRDLVEAVRAVAQRHAASPKDAVPKVESAGRAEPRAEEVSGELASRPLPRVLFDLLEAQVTGTLEVRRDRVRKGIFLVTGHPVGAESNVRQETLGYYLVARRLIDDAQHEQALALSKKEGTRLGQALVRLGFVTEQDLVRHLQALVRLKIVSSLRWSHGDYRLVRGDTFSERLPKASIEPVGLVLGGLKRTAHADDIAKQLALRAETRAFLTPRAERYQEEFARVFGPEAMAALRGRPRLGELLRRGREAVQILAGVDALLQTGMAEADDRGGVAATAAARTARRGATAAFAAITEASPQADPLALSNLAEPTVPGGLPGGVGAIQAERTTPGTGPEGLMAAAQVDSGRGASAAPVGSPAFPPAQRLSQVAPVSSPPSPASLYDELFGEDRSQVGPVPQPAAEAVRPDEGAVPQPMEIAESGVIEIPPPPERVLTQGPREPDPRVEEARSLILSTYLRIHDKNFYQVLGISTDATQDEIAAAYGAAVQRFRLADFKDFELGRDYARLEEIHLIFRRAYEILSDPLKRLDYDRRIGVGGTVPELPPVQPAASDPLAAELRFREGMRALEAERYAEAAEDFAAAVRLAPEAADYHALAALALHRAHGAAARQAVEGYLQQAFAIDAELPLAHEVAGRILSELGDDEGAVAHLEQALDGDPTRFEAFGLLEQILTRRKEWRRLERRYRKMIHRTGDRDPATQLRLWWNLAEIYRARMGDLESARVAFETACRLAPDEPMLQQSLAEVTAQRPELWRETARALRTWWRLRPEDPTPGRQLFALHYAGGRRDAALVTAMALACRGDDGSPAAVELLGACRPRFLPRIPALDVGLLNRIRHPDDDPEIGELFALVGPVVSEVHSFGLADLGVSDADRLAPAQIPEAFGRVLGYVCGLLGVPEPALYRRADFDEDVHVAGTAPPLLLCGPGALLETDAATLAFRLGRAATYLLPGRALGGAFPARVLKGFLLGVMAFCTGGLSVEDPDGTVARLQARLGALPGDVQARVRELVAELSRGRTTLNLSRYSRALARTADRIGLVLCNDLTTAARVLAASQAGAELDDLIDFALSDEYLETRERLGLAVVL